MMSGGKWASLGVRAIAIGLVLASPWLPPRKRASDEKHVFYVVDRSMSVGATGLEKADQYLRDVWAASQKVNLGVIAFDGRAEILSPLGAHTAPKLELGKEPWSSDAAGAVRLAAAALPQSGHRTIVVLSDGRATRGDVEAETRAAAAHGIRVDVVPIEGAPRKGPTIKSVKPRALRVAEGQPVALDVELDADDESYVRVEWTRDGVRMPEQMAHSVYRGAGVPEPPTSVELHDPSPPPGPHVYEVKLSSLQRMRHRKFRGAAPDEEPKEDPVPPAVAAVNVEGRSRAIVFSAMGTVPPVLASALSESKLEARGLPLDRLGDPSSYSGADLLVLADVRVSGAANDDTALTRAAQSGIIDYVAQGGGLLVTGGVFGLAPEYAGTPIARILPVEIEDKGHVEDPPVSLAIMLDRSGSMSASVGSHTKIELAIEASLGAADVLRATDEVAIASVDTETHWDIPLGAAERLPSLRAEVRKVRATGGGIYVFTALRDAYAALEKARSPIRHVILFSDTSDSEQQVEDCPFEPCASGRRTAEELAHAARVRGITTTVVGIGEESAKDTEFLKRLAAAAGGRFYLTAEGSDLRRIFLSETRVLAQSNMREKKVPIAQTSPHPLLAGIDVGRMPELNAFVETRQRSGADTALVLPTEGRPLLATWRYGLGKVAALTTDLVEGWGELSTSEEAGQLLRQTTRHLLRQQTAHQADAKVTLRDRSVEVLIEMPSDAPANAAPRAIDLFAIDSTGKTRKLEADIEDIGPGRFIARARSQGESVVIARARDARGALMAEAVGRADRAMELSGKGVDDHALAEIARIGEGRVGPAPTETLARTARPAKILEATWPWALVGAGILVVIDLMLRRIRSGSATVTRLGTRELESTVRDLRAA